MLRGFGWNTRCAFNARDKEGGEVVLPAISFFNGDLRDVACGREDEIRVFNAIFPAVGHPDDERLKRHRSEELANAGFHRRKI